MQVLLCRISLPPGENLLTNDSYQGFQLLSGGIPAKRNPERAVHHLVRTFHGLQNMASVTLCTGRTGGYTDAVILQNIDGVLGGNAGDGEGKNMGCFVDAVNEHTVQTGEFFHKGVMSLP